MPMASGQSLIKPWRCLKLAEVKSRNKKINKNLNKTKNTTNK